MEAGLHSCFEKKGGIDYIGLIQVWAECVPYFPNGRAIQVHRGLYPLSAQSVPPALLCISISESLASNNECLFGRRGDQQSRGADNWVQLNRARCSYGI